MSITFDQAKLHNSFLTDEHRQWQQQLRRFLDAEVAPYADEWDEAGEIPDHLWQ